MNGEKIYNSLTVGELGSLSYQGRTDDAANWLRFAAKVEQLEQMEIAGLIRITRRHREGQTGNEHIDMVLFRRLR
jgi:hypothetical protein